jgi:hypothetical protein
VPARAILPTDLRVVRVATATERPSVGPVFSSSQKMMPRPRDKTGEVGLRDRPAGLQLRHHQSLRKRLQRPRSAPWRRQTRSLRIVNTSPLDTAESTSRIVTWPPGARVAHQFCIRLVEHRRIRITGAEQHGRDRPPAPKIILRNAERQRARSVAVAVRPCADMLR